MKENRPRKGSGMPPKNREIPEQIRKRFDEEDLRYAYCPTGWIDLITELDDKLAVLVPEYKVRQIKEKFAGLRYYVDVPLYGDGSSRNQAHDLISEYENKSYSICDICGDAGKEVNLTGWMATRCEAHNDKTGIEIENLK
jgi:hypothetical protein